MDDREALADGCPVAVDVFAGGGGLTVGLKRAGFRVAAAVEIDPHAHATYAANHPDAHTLRQDIKKVKGEDLLAIAGGSIDLLAGCPPCQGFTSLTAKYDKVDPRNQLIFEMSRLAREVRPRSLMMENVPGLSRKAQRLYDGLKRSLQEEGYTLTEGVLEVADYGVPQFRRRLVLLAGLGFAIELPKPTHAKGGADGRSPWRTVKDAIGNMPRPEPLSKAKRKGPVRDSDWHIVRDLSPANVRRLQAAKAGMGWMEIPEALRPPCHHGEYRGFSNVYGRMEWHRPAPTITGGCTTFSKGRFGHPTEDRTISVREAATLQTFPSDYRFDVPYMEHVCNVIGNALPCDFAAVVSQQCYAALAAMTLDTPSQGCVLRKAGTIS